MARKYARKESVNKEQIEALVKAEKRIAEAAKAVGLRWRWAPYSKPSSGGPYMWNDIIVTDKVSGKGEVMPAIELVERVEELK